MIDCLASQPHYVDHLAPIWRALPHGLRGRLYCSDRATWRHAAAHGLDPEEHMPRLARGEWRHPGALVMVAGHMDYRRTGRARVIFVEHGAGQTYSNRDPHYSGGVDRDRVVLFLVPNSTVAARCDAPAAVVGCPRLAGLHAARASFSRGKPTVAVSFHWPCTVAPEAGWAFPHYRDWLASIVRGNPQWRWIGHGHPRAWRTLGPYWQSIGVEPVKSWTETAARADVYVADNSSTLYEAAALGVPVVALNAPWWRRHVNHGLRFWDQVPGVEVDMPADLPDAVELAFGDYPARDRTDRIAATVYEVPHHRAAAAAVEAIQALTPTTRAGSVAAT